MILMEVRDYLRRSGRASLRDIALHVDAESAAVQGILDHLIQKGQVVHLQASSACGTSCCKCDIDAVEVYVWSKGSDN